MGWAVAPESEALPAPRTDATSFTANGAVYVIGGLDDEGVPQQSMLWAVPDTTTGDYEAGSSSSRPTCRWPPPTHPSWASASHVFIFGGETPDGPTDGSLRAEISPRPPFFQLGIAGATIPGLAIKGEVGQQLGYMNAMGVGMLNFVILVILGVAFSRPESSKRVIGRTCASSRSRTSSTAPSAVGACLALPPGDRQHRLALSRPPPPGPGPARVPRCSCRATATIPPRSRMPGRIELDSAAIDHQAVVAVGQLTEPPARAATSHSKPSGSGVAGASPIHTAAPPAAMAAAAVTCTIQRRCAALAASIPTRS